MSRQHNLICMVPFGVYHKVHITIALTQDDEYVTVSKREDEEEIQWHDLKDQ